MCVFPYYIWKTLARGVNTTLDSQKSFHVLVHRLGNHTTLLYIAWECIPCEAKKSLKPINPSIEKKLLT